MEIKYLHYNGHCTPDFSFSDQKEFSGEEDKEKK
jgi:hypothetical protein